MNLEAQRLRRWRRVTVRAATMTTPRLVLILTAFVAACSASPVAEQREPTPPPAAEPAAEPAAACTSDGDCAVSAYYDIEAAGGCCTALVGPGCEAPVVTTAEAERRREAWEAQCAAVRCAPNTECPAGAGTPAPACRDGACVDTARPAE